MLDEGAFVYSVDKGNALGQIAGQPLQLKQQFDVNLEPATPKLLVLAGMGGSALAAEFIRHWLSDRLTVPFIVVRGYDLPACVNQDSLVFISSYSGNTEETLACYAQAKERGSKLVVVSAGGKLTDMAKADNLPLLAIPTGVQPRLAALWMVKALAVALDKLGITQQACAELEQGAAWVENQIGKWVSSVPVKDNQAKQLAQKLVGHPVVVYSGPTMAALAQRWKISINENGKNVAFYYELPEFNHNEFQGWLNPQTKPIKVIELQSSLDNDRIAKRWEISNRLLSGKMPSPTPVMVEGETKLEQMLWAAMLGDFVGVYLGILNKVDPASVDLIENLKKELG